MSQLAGQELSDEHGFLLGRSAEQLAEDFPAQGCRSPAGSALDRGDRGIDVTERERGLAGRSALDAVDGRVADTDTPLTRDTGQKAHADRDLVHLEVREEVGEDCDLPGAGIRPGDLPRGGDEIDKQCHGCNDAVLPPTVACRTSARAERVPSVEPLLSHRNLIQSSSRPHAACLRLIELLRSKEARCARHSSRSASSYQSPSPPRAWRRQARQLDHDAPAGRRAGTARPLAVHVEGHEPVLADEPGQSLGLDRDGRARPAKACRGAVLDRTATILGIEAVVVHDVVTQDGALVEDTYDWYVQDAKGNVWYLGEETKEYEHGKVVSTGAPGRPGSTGRRRASCRPSRGRNGLPAGVLRGAGRGSCEDPQRRRAGRSAVRLVRLGRLDEGHDPLKPSVLEYKFYARGVGPILVLGVSGGSSREELVSFGPA